MYLFSSFPHYLFLPIKFSISSAMDWNFTYRGKRFRLGRENVRDPGRSDAFRTFLHHQPDVVSERFNLSDFETLWYALRFSLRATEDASDTIDGPEFKFRTHEAVYLRWRKKRMPAHMFFCETLCFLQRKAILTSPNRILDPKNFLGQPCDHQVRTCTYATTTWYCIVPTVATVFFDSTLAVLSGTCCFQQQLWSIDDFTWMWRCIQQTCASRATTLCLDLRYAGHRYRRTVEAPLLVATAELLHFLHERPPMPLKTFLQCFDACLSHPASHWPFLCLSTTERHARLRAAAATTAREPTSYASDASDVAAAISQPARVRMRQLVETASVWPAAVPPPQLSSQITAYRCYFVDALKPPFLCAVCTCPTTRAAAELLNLRELCSDLMILHSIFSAKNYLQRYYAYHASDLPSTFRGLQIETCQQYLASLPAELHAMEPVPRQSIISLFYSLRYRCSVVAAAVSDHVCFPLQDAWLLHFSNQASWAEAAADPAAPLFITCCQYCCPFLRCTPPSMPPRSLANNNLCIGPPPELQDLSLGEQIFIARGHALRRLRTLSHTGDPAARQSGLLGTTSAIAFPQDPVSILSALPATPESLCDYISVFFPNEAETDLRQCREFIVRRSVVHSALLWLLHHNPYYADLQLNLSTLDTLPEDDVPLPWLQHAHATNMSLTRELGPADASSTFDGQSATLGIQAAVIDSSTDSHDPLHLWQTALRACDQFETHTASQSDLQAADFQVAWTALSRLAASAEHPSFLQDTRHQQAPEPSRQKISCVLPHADEPLNSYDPSFWAFCFPCLFPYGDGIDGQIRPKHLSDYDWGMLLVQRQDRGRAHHWRTDLDFVSVLYSVLHRRRLLRAVRVHLHSPTFHACLPALHTLQAVDWAHVASTVGE